jgi:tRNA-dihydrouridine synthase A
MDAGSGTTTGRIERRVSVAPMMDWTDRHCRYFLRGFSPRVLLYTEMLTAAAIERGDGARLLRYSPEERPLALQLGGSDPRQLAVAARAGADAGYDEINLNCGCPSDRVHAGSFGACLMRAPERVADCVAAMRTAVCLPITVKLRIGVVERMRSGSGLGSFDERDFADLQGFVERVAQAGCRHFIVHARKAVLGGLSPRENREIPPLRHDIVQRLAQAFPSLWFAVNGGLRTAPDGLSALRWSGGIMLGREAYHRPAVLAELHAAIFSDGRECCDTRALLERMAAYAEGEVASGEAPAAITRHMLGLYAGVPGARRFRQCLSEQTRALGTGREAARVLRQLLLKAAERDASVIPGGWAEAGGV